MIFGVNGQDGSYLSELLLGKGYNVVGVMRYSSTDSTERIEHLIPHSNFSLIEGDVTDATGIHRAISKMQPAEIYNLAAMSHVGVSFDQPVATFEVNAIGPLNILEAIRQVSPHSKFYHACHDIDTLVVTPDGLKAHSELSIGDSVYTINENTDKIEINRIKKVLIYDYCDNMIQISGRRIDQLITPNHLVLLRKDDGSIIRVMAKDLKSLFKYTRTSEYSMLLPTYNFSEKYIDKIKLSDLADNEFADNCSVNLVDEIDAKSFCYLLGLYIGDGYFASSTARMVKYKKEDVCVSATRDSGGKFCFNDKNRHIKSGGKSSYILFAIPEGDKARNSIIKCLEYLGFDFRTKKQTVEFSCSALASVLRLCGTKCKQKNIPNFVFNFPVNLQECVYKGLIDSDGSYRNNNKSCHAFSTSSDKLAADFIRLCASIGKYCSFAYGVPNVKCIDGHKIHPGPNYVFNIAQKNTNKLYPHHINYVPHNEKVWCLTVENNHNFLVSRNGKLAFSGNSTSELFGNTTESPQNENTAFHPCSPYAIAKLAAHMSVDLYRKAYGIFACAGILFNHESRRRGSQFVTQKIARYVAKLIDFKDKHGTAPRKGVDVLPLLLGNLEAKRDWSHAKDMVKGMYLMLQQDEPADFVLASGKSRSVRQFLEAAFRLVDLDYKDYVEIDPNFHRPADVNYLLGDPSKAIETLGWKPEITFDQMVQEMVMNNCMSQKDVLCHD